MKYLADTNILCQQDTDAKIRNWVVQHYLTIGLSAVTIAEIAQGIEALPRGKRRRKLEAALEEIVRDYPVVPFGPLEAREWGRYVNTVHSVPVLDSLIAATALANGWEVVTENTSDFPGVPTVNPSKVKRK
jgi:predicted nucleic acid-binding protein